MNLQQILRYPIKGLSVEVLDSVELVPGEAIPADRKYAIAHGQTVFDPDRPQHMSKTNFLMLMRNPKLAGIRATFDTTASRVKATFPDGTHFTGDLDAAADRTRFESLLADFVRKESRGGPPRVVSARGHHFFDAEETVVSLLNLASVAALGQAVRRELDPVRFRANLHVAGLPAWEEADLVGKDIRCGSVAFHVERRITRCMATSVNPTSAAVDINVPAMLRRHFDTNYMGLYLTVRKGGRIRTGDVLEAVPTQAEENS
jgi:uncharacterized protein YcbX